MTRWVCPNCGGPGRMADTVMGTFLQLDPRYNLGHCAASKPCSKKEVPLVTEEVWDASQETIQAAQVAAKRATLLRGLHKGTIKPGDKKYLDAVQAHKEVNGE